MLLLLEVKKENGGAEGKNKAGERKKGKIDQKRGKIPKNVIFLGFLIGNDRNAQYIPLA